MLADKDVDNRTQIERHTVPNNYARGPSQLGDPLPSCSLHLWWGGFPGNGKPPGHAPDRQERTTAELARACSCRLVISRRYIILITRRIVVCAIDWGKPFCILGAVNNYRGLRNFAHHDVPEYMDRNFGIRKGAGSREQLHNL